MADYHAFELQFPAARPYDVDEYRWATFVGEFVRPIAEQYSNLLYWTSYYTKYAEFKVLTDDILQVQPKLDDLERSGFVVKKLGRTLEEDLGGGRFIGPNSNSTPSRRAERILRSLKAVCDLLVDSVYKRADGYWAQEESGDRVQNPIGNHFFSVTHLYHNITAADGLIYPFMTPNLQLHLPSYYYYLNNKESFGQHTLLTPQTIRL